MFLRKYRAGSEQGQKPVDQQYLRIACAHSLLLPFISPDWRNCQLTIVRTACTVRFILLGQNAFRNSAGSAQGSL